LLVDEQHNGFQKSAVAYQLPSTVVGGRITTPSESMRSSSLLVQCGMYIDAGTQDWQVAKVTKKPKGRGATYLVPANVLNLFERAVWSV
jgi:hypothetical protein